MYQIVLEADGYLPYLISPEKGLRALVRKVLELAKEPARQCVDEVRQFVLYCEDKYYGCHAYFQKGLCVIYYVVVIVGSQVNMEI